MFASIIKGTCSLNSEVHFIGVQRYAKKRIAIWKTCIAIHIITIHLVSLFICLLLPLVQYYDIIQGS